MCKERIINWQWRHWVDGKFTEKCRGIYAKQISDVDNRTKLILHFENWNYRFSNDNQCFNDLMAEKANERKEKKMEKQNHEISFQFSNSFHFVRMKSTTNFLFKCFLLFPVWRVHKYWPTFLSFIWVFFLLSHRNRKRKWTKKKIEIQISRLLCVGVFKQHTIMLRDYSSEKYSSSNFPSVRHW